MEAQKTKRREWVKTAAIIFLVILLVLTFFSNTIMNRSLPEVAAKYVESGSINARIRGTGTVSANEVYAVTIPQTKKVRSVLVKTGDTVSAGDVLFRLEPADSAELQEAQKQLEDMELAYQKRMIERGNSDSMESREVEKLQETYEEALAAYRLYSTDDPSKVKLNLEYAKSDLNVLQQQLKEAQSALSGVSDAYAEANSAASELAGDLAEAQGELTAAETKLASFENAERTYQDALMAQSRDEYLYQAAYDELVALTKANFPDLSETDNDFAAALAAVGTDPGRYLPEGNTEAEIEAYQTAYKTIEANKTAVEEAAKLLAFKNNGTVTDQQINAMRYELEQEVLRLTGNVSDIEGRIEAAKGNAELLSVRVKRCEDAVDHAQEAVGAQQTVLERWNNAVSAAQALETAEEALEDKMFQIGLGSSDSLDLQAEKEAIEKQRELIAQLSDTEGGTDVVANVSGVISEINCSAGTTIGADMPMASITVTDRGYTLKLSVTTEQARKVQPGDTATITNYYSGDVTATLETVANDPQSLGKNKFLIFRLTGDVEPGATMTLSIGQKSAKYDCLIPNSAVRTDANGTYVLAVEAKSSPLGNRYVAVRADVTVLASDDTSSAVSGLSNGDFVITTSTRPIEAGDQVRMVDE